VVWIAYSFHSTAIVALLAKLITQPSKNKSNVEEGGSGKSDSSGRQDVDVKVPTATGRPLPVRCQFGLAFAFDLLTLQQPTTVAKQVVAKRDAVANQKTPAEISRPAAERWRERPPPVRVNLASYFLLVFLRPSSSGPPQNRRVMQWQTRQRYQG
jgi:hypothetical protein